MNPRETLAARFRQVLDEHEHGAAGVDLVERLTDAACETLTAVLVALGAGPDLDPVVAARRMRERAEAAEEWQVRAQVPVAACAEAGLHECPACDHPAPVEPKAEPSDEQIERAARALRDDQANREQFWEVPEWGKASHGAKELYRAKARAALTAAGVAPVSEGTSAKVVMRGVDTDCARGICPDSCSHLMWYCGRCTSEGGWGASREQLEKWAAQHVCPVPPVSEGARLAELDEAALYRVIDDAQRSWGAGDRCEPIAAPITRAVTDHLRGGSR